ncbi:phosphoribosylglycinamide formyltransferase [Candidatus Fermentibacteria bacterium]|nr:phosphoribosylglycinamide formyltransferase [Candidatus Fermentibacteria bacterium]
MKIAVLASGRGSNFEALCKADLGPGRVELLVCDRPDAPVAGLARRLGVEILGLDPGPKRTVLSVECETRLADELVRRGTDLVCLAGFMRMLKGPMLSAFRGRIMNVHPSLLPAFPGLDSQRRALEYGVKIAGCTVHYVDEGMDTGPIIAQAAVEVREGDGPEDLAGRILSREHEIFPLAVRLHCEGRLAVAGRRVSIREP